MPEEQYKHIFLSGPTHKQGFTHRTGHGSEPRIPARDRFSHSDYLKQRFETAWTEAGSRQSVIQAERHAVYIEFVSEPGFDLMTQSLEDIRSRIRLLNIRKRTGDDQQEQTLATVYVPLNKRRHFLNKITKYAMEEKNGKPKNNKLINSISDIRASVLKSFWLDDIKLLPGKDSEWVEVWLSSDQDEVFARFTSLLNQLNIDRADHVLRFPERTVELIMANQTQLEKLIEVSDDIAELRAAKEIATFYIEMENHEQVEQVRELLSRTSFNDDTDVAICILDTGVNNGHLLIKPVLDDADLHTVKPEWGVHDHKGHGTLMAGTAAYGDLLAVLNNKSRVQINHRLESAKILPPDSENLRDLWGYMTAQGLSRAEIQSPQRKRIMCMAVTSTDSRDSGKPSSWSAEVDALASGYEDDTRRLIVVCAGNVDNSNWRNYPNANQTDEVHDPGQAWNALTVGAYSEKTAITDHTWKSYYPIAPHGGLSPFSTTSLSWPWRKWPIKPEVVFEGGNVASGPNDSIVDVDDLQLLSTYYNPQVAQFASFNGTSAASAQAAWMAAQIQTQYPDAWPETIRALIVHTAEWTKTMKTQFIKSQSPNKTDFAKLLRICGYGVPNLNRALYCSSNSLTLISQAQLQPFYKDGSHYKTNEMHLYKLPWPSDELSNLGETKVTMRVTLSYFIEPGPGEVGWDNRYRYASHALRFAVNGPGESEGEFVRRINIQARDDGEHPGTEGPEWLIGDARNVGSIHSDIWQGQAAELANSNIIGIYPSVGWWRERHNLKRWNKKTRYALIVSIYTPEIDIDIYTPVETQVRLSVPVEIIVNHLLRR
ncbi:S8 family peptidase [Candidatus Magnetominusculus dajiuhuensis]|uniref:S8 family peptidase n=1 Tax=Candidatus Magnetominusculus dajiuhuensis TaxID=3137712 RepID=UPI003B435726